MISETAAEVIAFTNALPEWLCKSRQEKVSLLTHESWSMKVKCSHFIAGYAAVILWRGTIWPCGAFEGGEIISVPPFTLKGPAVRIL
jgi:hypothetical protein